MKTNVANKLFVPGCELHSANLSYFSSGMIVMPFRFWRQWEIHSIDCFCSALFVVSEDCLCSVSWPGSSSRVPWIQIKQLTGDILLPAVVFIVVKARVPHLGAYLHFLTDFAHSKPEDEYTLVTYEVAFGQIIGHHAMCMLVDSGNCDLMLILVVMVNLAYVHA